MFQKDRWDKYVEKETIQPARKAGGMRIRPRAEPGSGFIHIKDMFARIEKDNNGGKELRKLKYLVSIELSPRQDRITEFLFHTQTEIGKFEVLYFQNKLEWEHAEAMKKQIAHIEKKIQSRWAENIVQVEWETRVNMRATLASCRTILQWNGPPIPWIAPKGLRILPEKENINECSMENIVIVCEDIMFRWYTLEPSSEVFDFLMIIDRRLSEYCRPRLAESGIMNYLAYVDPCGRKSMRANEEFYGFMHSFSIDITRTIMKWNRILETMRVTDAPIVSEEKRSFFEKWLVDYSKHELTDTVRKRFEKILYMYNCPPSTIPRMITRLIRTKQVDACPEVVMNPDFYTQAYSLCHGAPLRHIQDTVIEKKPEIILDTKTDNPVILQCIAFYKICFFDIVFFSFTQKHFLDSYFVEPTYQQLRSKPVVVGRYLGTFLIASVTKKRTFRTSDLCTMMSIFLDETLEVAEGEHKKYIRELQMWMFEKGIFAHRPEELRTNVYKEFEEEISRYMAK